MRLIRYDNKILKELFLLSSALLFCGCGGGGGSSPSDPVISEDDPEEVIPAPDPSPDPDYSLNNSSGDFYTGKPYLIQTTNVSAVETAQGVASRKSGDENRAIWEYVHNLDWLNSAAGTIPQNMSGVLTGQNGTTRAFTENLLPGDPRLPEQWYIYNDASRTLAQSVYNYIPRMDFNLPQLWNAPYHLTGENTVITVIGFPVDFDHEELKDRKFSPTNDVLDQYANLPSGTMTLSTEYASIIASSFNGKGLRGIAWNSGIYSLNPYAAGDNYNIWLDWILPLKDMYAALGRTGIIYDSSVPGIDQEVDNTSFLTTLFSFVKGRMLIISGAGDNYDLSTYFGISDSETQLCRELGTSCAYSQTSPSALNPLGVIVSSVDPDGKRAQTSDASTGVWVTGLGGGLFDYVNHGGYGSFPTAFSSLSCGDLPDSETFSSFTLDTDCKYTDMSSSTNAAAAQIAGISGLLTELEPGLFPLQIKYILAKSARNDRELSSLRLDKVTVSGNSNLVARQGWIENGAGWRRSSEFGFGIPDAHKAAQLVKTCSEDPGCNQRHSNPSHVTLEISAGDSAKCQGNYDNTQGYYIYQCSVPVSTNISEVESLIFSYQGDHLLKDQTGSRDAVIVSNLQISLKSPDTISFLKPYGSLWNTNSSSSITTNQEFVSFAGATQDFYQEKINAGEAFELQFISKGKLNITGSSRDTEYTGDGRLVLDVYYY